MQDIGGGFGGLSDTKYISENGPGNIEECIASIETISFNGN